MMPTLKNCSRAVGALGMYLLLCFTAAVHARATSPGVHHDLRISLTPATHELAAVDRITLEGAGAWWPALRLAPRARDIAVTLDGQPAAFTFRAGRLTLADAPGSGVLEIGYRCVFNDPVPLAPANSDNPGYGVTASISERGTFLLSGAGWYPRVEGTRAVYRLTVEAPRGTLAVTTGRLIEHVTQADRTVSRWLVTRPVEGLALSAGPYEVRRKDAAGIQVMTYFFSGSAPLAEKYLDAAGGYLALYQELFGPYPFEKFAVVENFFPTGYGFPSYTLMGGSVLRLPFIVHTSLPHEIAHSWWGNGVLVDYRQGNWCEGLTTYVSDYYLRERASATRARQYRLQMLRDYTTLVGPSRDFPLSQFKSRVDPATRAIGYDKSAMVFHMLRRKVGDQAFWQALRDIARQRLFEATTWIDLRDIFQRHSRTDLKTFFHQWVFRKGAPFLTLEKPSAVPAGGRWRIEAAVTQAAPFYNLDVEAVLENAGGRRVKRIHLAGPRRPFALTDAAEPRRLAIDPDVQIFRRLHAAELPPVVNSIKGASRVSLVLPTEAGDQLKAISKALIHALGLKDVAVVSTSRPGPGNLPTTDIIVVGRPRELSPLLKGQYARELRHKAFEEGGEPCGNDGQTLFAVLPHPGVKGRVMALFCPQSTPEAATAARKITHYGRYSYLVFTGARVAKRGTWPVRSSPLIYRWPGAKVGE